MTRIRTELDPPPGETGALLEGLKQSSAPFLPHGDGFQPVAFFVETDAAHATGSGLYGFALFDWFHVEFLHVEPSLRGAGLGSKLLAEAEAWSRARGLAGMWLQTMEFQARGFYEKQGFTLIATHEGRPAGSATHLMERRF